MKKTYITIKPSLKPLIKAPVFLFEPAPPTPVVEPPILPEPPGQLVSEVGFTSSSISEIKMETLIDHLIKGQEKLEWAVENQLSIAQADRELFTKTMTAHVEGLKSIPSVQQAATGEGRVHTPHPSGMALQKYVPGEDPDAFLVNFERAARAMSWPEEKWPFFLAPLLTAEAQSAYQAANPLGTTPYATIKMVILDHLGLDQEAYRVRFRKEKGVPGENPKTLFFRLKMAADKWLRPDVCTKEEILNKVYVEQFMEALPYATQRWLKQHVGLTVEQAIEMASQYARAQPKSIPWEPEKTSKGTPTIKTDKRPKPVLEAPRPYRPPGMMVPPTKGPQCFECGEWGHIARMCPKRKSHEEPMEVGYLPRTVMYSAEMGSTFYPQTSTWREEEGDPDTEWPSGVNVYGSFKADGWDCGVTPLVTTKAGSTASRTNGVSPAEEIEEESSAEPSPGREADGNDKPGGQRSDESPCHAPTGGAWLKEVRGRVAGWVGRRRQPPV
ncbi:uncharacterized protein LOC144785636 [Lissotriton helveticus]